MSSKSFNLADLSANVPDASKMRFGIVVAEWNHAITGKLLQGALDTLAAQGVKESNIIVKNVPGSFELVYGSTVLSRCGLVDAVIAIGCVVRGDTPHFDYICEGVTRGISQLNLNGPVPVIFGLLTTNPMEQAEERAGGRLGNKGSEFAVTAIKMVDFAWQLR